MDNYRLQAESAKKIFLKYDREKLIQKFHLQSDEQWLYLSYLNTPCRISRADGHLEQQTSKGWQECLDYNTVMTVYDLLCYSKGNQMPELSGQWCAVGTFIVTGITETEGFTGKYARFFDGHTEQLKAACEALGGILQPSMAGADVTCVIPVTPFFPVLLQFWEGDEEFPPKIKLLWDRNADQFLHFETTFYLQGDLLRCLKEYVNNEKNLS